MKPVYDLTGQRFGRLVVLGRSSDQRQRGAWWLCECDCGARCVVVSHNLVKGMVKSCGCLKDENRRIDITGETRGQLTAIRPTDERRNGKTVWEWRCSCGATVYKATTQVSARKSTMCPACAKKLKSQQAKAMADGIQRDEETGAPLGAVESIRAGKLYRTNTSGVRGVSWHSVNQRWVARIHVDGKMKVIGYYRTIEEAAKARAEAVKRRYGADDPTEK